MRVSVSAKGKKKNGRRGQEVAGGRLKLWIRLPGRPRRTLRVHCSAKALQETNPWRQEQERSEPRVGGGGGRGGAGLVETGGEHAGLLRSLSGLGFSE